VEAPSTVEVRLVHHVGLILTDFNIIKESF